MKERWRSGNVETGGKTSEKIVLRMQGITKRFPGVLALDGVDFDLRPGEVHVLLGENGAGKSTLIKVLAGVFPPDSGTIYIDGKAVSFLNPGDAQAAGISVIYQELNLVPYLSVAENIMLGHEPVLAKPKLVDYRRLYDQAREALAAIGADVNPRAKVEELGMAYKQMVEIAKAISRHARILIMDEPTSSLSDEESDLLFQLISRLKAKGVAIIYICHRMEEVYRVGDRATVLRDGRKVGTVRISETGSETLISMIVGRRIEEKFPFLPRRLGEPVLEVQGLTRKGVLHDVSFSLRTGEILGITGAVGSGRTELARAIFGADPIERGVIKVRGHVKHIRSCRDAIGCGMGLIPEDRKSQGLVLIQSVRQNTVLASLGRFLRVGLLDFALERKAVKQLVNRLEIKTSSPEVVVENLSGGNQQKVVLAKWMCSGVDILVFDEPTRGIDVGSKVEIYKLIMEAASEGAAILVMSSELPEVLGICDRILVMRKGRLVAEFNRGEATPEKLHAAAVGLAKSGGVA